MMTLVIRVGAYTSDITRIMLEGENVSVLNYNG